MCDNHAFDAMLFRKQLEILERQAQMQKEAEARAWAAPRDAAAHGYVARGGMAVKRILAVDPGLATGWATAGYSNTDGVSLHGSTGGLVTVGQTGKGGVVDPDIDVILAHAKRADVVVLETYEIQERTTKFSRQYHSLEIIGLLKYHADRVGVEVVMQGANEAKSTITDDRLRALDSYYAPFEHGRDALRHLYLFAAKKKLVRLTNGVWA